MLMRRAMPCPIAPPILILIGIISIHALAVTRPTCSGRTMHAVTASAFGAPRNVLRLEANWPRPCAHKNTMLIRTAACSLSPGDWRMLSGEASFAKKPDAFPYVPGLDVCGVVVENGAAETETQKFAVGDKIVATWSGAFGTGGLAEYSLVDTSMAVPKPDGLSCLDAAALANSAGHALLALRTAGVTPGDRVLILGGSGGVGSAMVQLARVPEFGASFVAATSSDFSLLASLGVDQPIDHTREDWWSPKAMATQPFDVIIDCAEGEAAWRRVRDGNGVLKRGGRFVAVVINDWHIQFTRWWHLFGFLLPPLGRVLRSQLVGAVTYAMYVQSLDAAVLGEVLELASTGQLRAVVDSSGPFAFSSEGAAAAFDRLRSRHAKGKVVVAIDAMNGYT